MCDEKISLTKAQALSVLPDGDTVHTFRGSAGVLLGADWPRADIEALLDKHPAEITGPNARSWRHGIVCRDTRGWLYIETDEAKLAELERTLLAGDRK